jgi:hypothetical protein
MSKIFSDKEVASLNYIRHLLDFLTHLGLKESRCITLGEIVDFSERMLLARRNRWFKMMYRNQ